MKKFALITVLQMVGSGEYVRLLNCPPSLKTSLSIPTSNGCNDFCNKLLETGWYPLGRKESYANSKGETTIVSEFLYEFSIWRILWVKIVSLFKK